MLILLVLILMMALFIKCCAVHTPSTNPNKPPAHNIYETLRHPSTLMVSISCDYIDYSFSIEYRIDLLLYNRSIKKIDLRAVVFLLTQKS